MQNIFNFHNIFFTVRAFVGRFDDWSLRCFIGFNCEGNRKMIWQVSFYYGWLKVIVACYTIGDNVVYGISWVSDLSCWSLKLEEKFTEISVKVLVFFTSGKASLSEFTYKTGKISSDVIAGFTPGYYWFLIFENRKQRGSLPFQIYA